MNWGGRAEEDEARGSLHKGSLMRDADPNGQLSGPAAAFESLAQGLHRCLNRMMGTFK